MIDDCRLMIEKWVAAPRSAGAGPIRASRRPINPHFWDAIKRSEAFLLDRFRCGFPRRGHNGNNLICFIKQRLHAFFGQNAVFDDQLKPQRRFISLFGDRAKFGIEFRFGTPPAGRAVIRCHRSTGPHKLIGDGSALNGIGKGINNLQNPKRKLLRSCFQYRGIHYDRLFAVTDFHPLNTTNQSSIINHQSSI